MLRVWNSDGRAPARIQFPTSHRACSSRREESTKPLTGQTVSVHLNAEEREMKEKQGGKQLSLELELRSLLCERVTASLLATVFPSVVGETIKKARY